MAEPEQPAPPGRPDGRLLGRLVVLAALVGALGVFAAVNLSPAAVVQRKNLRITLKSQVQPYKLPRTRTAPIAALVSGHVEPVKGEVPDQLEGLKIKVNRHAVLQSRGLPACRVAQVNPASTTRALAVCGSALVGSGQFWAHIVLPDQGAYPTEGRLLVFNGIRGGRPMLLVHIFTAHPFATSFVIPFAVRRLRGGTYGTELSASLPEALGSWGYVDRIKLTLRRRYRHKGKQLSYFNASCPAPKRARVAPFALAYATFAFAEGEVGLSVDKSCGVRE